MSEDHHESDNGTTKYYHCTCCVDRFGSVGASCMCAEGHCTLCNRCTLHCKQPALHAILTEAERVGISARDQYDDAYAWFQERQARRSGDRRPEIRAGVFDHILTAEDCALLWACGIRADEDMLYATVRIRM